MRDASAMERLRRLTGPFVLRRLKTDKIIPGSDCTTVLRYRRVSVTPLQLDLTHGSLRADLARWPVEGFTLFSAEPREDRPAFRHGQSARTAFCSSLLV